MPLWSAVRYMVAARPRTMTAAPHVQAGTTPERARVARLRAGDEQAFVALVGELDGLLRRLARGIVRSEAQVDDAVQDTWIAVIRGLAGFEERSTLRTWICRILLNRARTAAVKDGRLVPASALDGDGDGDGDGHGDGLDRFAADGSWAAPPAAWTEERADVLAGRAELVALTSAAIDRLPERQRQVVTLRDVQGWTAEEVCNALDLTETNQRVLLHRARARVRVAVEAVLARGGATP